MLKLLLLIGSVGFAGAIACSSNNTSGSGGSGFGGSPSNGSTGATMPSTGSDSGGGSTFTTSSGPTGPSSDFPKDPIVDASAPTNAGSLFAGAGGGSASGGPCLVEPEPNTLFPNNWLRPRFRYIPTGDENLFEIRLHAANEIHDLVVYTGQSSWTMDKDMWTNLAAHIQDQPITMTVTGAHFDGTTLTEVSVGTTGPMTIAPAQAAGAVVYWTTSGGSSLKGFQIGDETVGQTLIPSQVQMPTVGGAVNCIGCHTSTPDGKFVGFTAQGPWGNVLASVETMTVGQQPPFLGAGALQFLDSNDPLGIQTYSKAHWADGDHKVIAPMGDSPGSKLIWIDLEATDPAKTWGQLKRDGDTVKGVVSEVGAPTWSHDGKTIVYVSADGNVETTGRLGTPASSVDLRSIPYANGMGGTSTKIPGASDSALEEFYPAFSPDDGLLAFVRIPFVAGNPVGTPPGSDPNGVNDMYNQPLDEVFVIPSKGGTATRVAANDPPACTSKASPGVTNSWPKWSPQQTTVGSKTYYWIIFSSTRDEMGNPQLYITGVVVDGSNVKTYGSIYLWNQPSTENNHTPAWDYFKIPPSGPS